MTVLEMVSDGYEELISKKDSRVKRKKVNKYSQYSRLNLVVSEPDPNDAGDTEPVTEFPVELLEAEYNASETPTRISTEQLRGLYTIFLNCNKAGNQIYQDVIAEVRSYLESCSTKLKSIDIQQAVVYARLREGVMEYYCQLPTKNFDIVGEIELAEGNFSNKAEL
ncbi:MAG: hypothetical protein ACMG57_04320 [Candidatus Dojkabacteria bacterium]